MYVVNVRVQKMRSLSSHVYICRCIIICGIFCVCACGWWGEIGQPALLVAGMNVDLYEGVGVYVYFVVKYEAVTKDMRGKILYGVVCLCACFLLSCLCVYVYTHVCVVLLI